MSDRSEIYAPLDPVVRFPPADGGDFCGVDRRPEVRGELELSGSPAKAPPYVGSVDEPVWFKSAESAGRSGVPPFAAVNPAFETPATPVGQGFTGLHDCSVTPGAEVALLDADGVIISVNAAWRQSVEEDHIGGATHGVGMSYVELCTAAIPDLDAAALAEGLAEIVSGHRAGYAQPYVIAKASGLWWRHLRIVPFRLERSLQLIAIHENITDLSQARAALRNSSEQMLSAVAHERERIAFELHDSTSQHLAALGLGLIRLKHIVGDGAEDLIADMARSVQETVREIRVLSYLMKPLGLGRDGICPAARQFVSGFGARTGLQVEFRTKGSFQAIAETVEGAAYRILQEALSNVYKHAAASRVEVDLTVRAGALTVRVADDGRGISMSGSGQLAAAPGVGLASMESRVVQLGGALSISRGVLGTIVEAIIPLAGQQA